MKTLPVRPLRRPVRRFDFSHASRFLLIIVLLFSGGSLSAQEGSYGLPDWLDGFQMGGLVRFRPVVRENYNFDRSDRVLSTEYDSICSKARTTNRTCSQSGGTEYPDFSKSNHSTVPLYVSEENTQESVQQKVQLKIRKEFGTDMVANIVFQDARVWGGTTGSATGINTANSKTDEATDVREANLEIFDLIGPITLQAGRQVIAYGDQRLVGHLDWTGAGRSFDGLRFKFESDVFTSHLWGFVIAEDADDINGTLDGNESTPTLEDAYFAGWYNTWKPSEHLQAEVYYLGVYKKWTPRSDPLVVFVNDRPEILTDQFGLGIASQQRETQRNNLHTGGLRLTNRTKKGRATIPLDWTFEGAVQGGETGDQVTPENLDILFEDDKYKIKDADNNQIYQLKSDSTGYYVSEYAFHQLITRPEKYNGYAFALRLGWTPVKLVRVGVEYAEGSGDKNPHDLKDSTFQNLFHTNHAHYGQGDLASWRNMQGRNANLTFNFGDAGKLRISAWDIDKHRPEDAWYVASGGVSSVATTDHPTNYAVPTGSTESKGRRVYKKYLKRELYRHMYLRDNLIEELDLTYQIKHKGVVWNFGYSLIMAGDAARTASDDYGFALAEKYLDEVLYYESVHRTSRKIFVDGDYKSDARPPVFDPRASFAYAMMTFKF